MEKGQPAPTSRPTITIVIPALDEETALPASLAALERQRGAPPFETILADGGSRDGTVSCFKRLTRGWPPPGARAIACPRRGRAAQMNVAAAAATGEAIVFLHADTELPPAALAAVASALSDPGIVGGGFRLRYRERRASLRLIAAYATLRSRLRRVHYGDQAMFVRRSTFAALGGFPDVALFEDLRLSRALRRAGRVVTLPLAVRTSARRLLVAGVARTACRFAWLKLRHALGADPSRLRAAYPDIRRDGIAPPGSRGGATGESRPTGPDRAPARTARPCGNADSGEGRRRPERGRDR